MEEDIFISYCRKDILKAKKIKEDIERATSVKCWMDLDGIESGAQFEDVIISAIDKARIVVFMLSENSMKSNWAKDEVRYALQTHKRIIPVNIDHCTPKGWFLFRLSGYDVIDIYDANQKNKFFENISTWSGVKCELEKASTTKNEPPKTKSAIIYKFFELGQYLVFGTILAILLSMFTFGFLSMKQGGSAIFINILLCLCVGSTLFSTYMLFSKKKKIAINYIAFLDVVEIILLCIMAKRLAEYTLMTGYHFHSFPYTLISGLGFEMIRIGDVPTIFIMELLALLHILLLLGVLFVMINGTRFWNKLS